MRAHKRQIYFSSQWEISQHRCRRIMDHRTKAPHLNQNLCKLLLILFVVCWNPFNWCHYCMRLGSLWFTIKIRCCSSIRMFFWEEYLGAIIHWISYVFGPPRVQRRSSTFTSTIPFCYNTYEIIIYRSAR